MGNDPGIPQACNRYSFTSKYISTFCALGSVRSSRIILCNRLRHMVFILSELSLVGNEVVIKH